MLNQMNTLPFASNLLLEQKDTLYFLLGLCIVLITILIVFTFYKNYILKESRKKQEACRKQCEEYEGVLNELRGKHQELQNQYDELKTLDEKNKKLAYIDQLTELPNIHSLHEQLDQTIFTLGSEEIVGVLQLNLDNFKCVNDQLGRAYGDELLIDVAHRIRQALDENDYLARMGGDNFIVLCPNIEDTAAHEEKVKRIQTVFSYPYTIAGREISLCVSIGLCFLPTDGKTSVAILKNVSTAMQRAKRLGKNQYCYYEESITEHLTKELELQTELRHAIEHEAFQVYYHSIEDIKLNKIVGLEALLRWNHPEKGIMLPDEFLEVAKKTGLMCAIDRQVIKQVCRQCSIWGNHLQNMKVTVNCSKEFFTEERFISYMKEIIEEHSIPFGTLILEIKEEVTQEDLEYTINIIKQLNMLGVEVAYDQFGSDLASLTRLLQLPVDYIKIDKKITKGINIEQEKQQFLHFMLNFAKERQQKIIVCGIEEYPEDMYIRETECCLVQGYYYSIPVEAEDIMVQGNQIAIVLDKALEG